MATKEEKLQVFVDWWRLHCIGDEKGEAQIFLDRLFQAFGHDGVFEAGARPETRIKKKSSTRFADLVWPGKILLEMKKRGEDLNVHFKQVLDYWVNLVPERPKYVILCNFDEFHIYDLNLQLDEPLDVVPIESLASSWGPLAFWFKQAEEPVFGNDLVGITRLAANDLAQLFNSLMAREVDEAAARRLTLQCLVAMFSQKIGLLPRYVFSHLVDDCLAGRVSSYDAFGDLFERMNRPGREQSGRYAGVDYFNGGLFKEVHRIDLERREVELLRDASAHDWSKVSPAIFGSIFEDSLGKEERHALGAHYTSDVDILSIVKPTIVKPWREKVNAASTIVELENLLTEIRNYRVLDPSCGSGNFLYVAYREIKRIEKEIKDKLYSRYKNPGKKAQMSFGFVTAHQFFGIDKNEFAVELAKVTLMIAKKLAADELNSHEPILPLENLDSNFQCDDALFVDWPAADVIIGNPPYQSKNKAQQEFGLAYMNRLREHFNGEVPGHADYCVYWFRKAHDHLREGCYAGLVGTNTIRQNYSRRGGLQYIVEHGGTIFDAISSQEWSGPADVSVSIANWVKGPYLGKKRLLKFINGDHVLFEIDTISSSLSDFDITPAKTIHANEVPKRCFEGQAHGHASFLLPRAEAEAMIRQNPALKDVLFPYLIGRELVSGRNSQPRRYVIDFGSRDINQARSAQFRQVLKRIEENVLPAREVKLAAEEERNREARADNPRARINRHHEGFHRYWWRLSYRREDMLAAVRSRDRYIACSRHTKRPIFEFVSKEINPNDALSVFAFDDYYSFGILQSSLHWEWFTEACSTQRNDFRYTSESVFDTFPWPQKVTQQSMTAVVDAAKTIIMYRNRIVAETGTTLEQLYEGMEKPGKNPLKDLHNKLDRAVIQAYQFDGDKPLMPQVMDLNRIVSEAEAGGRSVIAPGIPSIGVAVPAGIVDSHCVRLI